MIIGMRRWLSGLCIAGALMIGAWSPVSAASISTQQDVLSRQQTSVAANHTLSFISPSGIDASTDTVIVTFGLGFNLGAIVLGDIALSHGPLSGLENVDSLGAAPGVGVWGAVVSGQSLTFTAPTNAAPGTVGAGDTIVIKIGLQVGTHQIVSPAEAGTYMVTIVGTFGDQGSLFVPIFLDDNFSVSATIAAAQSNSGGTGSSHVPPVISTILATVIGPDSVVVTWTTDLAANTVVNYGVTSAYGGRFESALFVTQHSATLTGLQPGTLYHFSVSSRTVDGDMAMSNDLTVRTASLPVAPVISNLRIENITDQTAIVLWETDQEATGHVNFGSALPYTRVEEVGTFGTLHSFVLSNLSQKTVYHFSVTSQNRGGQSTPSLDQTFETAETIINPTNVSAFFAVPGNARVGLSWKNPVASWFEKTVIVGRTDRYPLTIGDGRLIYQGVGESVTDSGLINGTRYFYTAFAQSVQGRTASGASAQAVPVAEPKKDAEPEKKPDVPKGTGEPKVPDASDPPSETKEPEGSVSSSSLRLVPAIYDASGSIPLYPDANGAIGVGTGKAVLVEIPVSEIGGTLRGAELMLDGAAFLLSYSGLKNVWTAVVSVPDAPGRYSLIVQATADDGRTAEWRASVRTQAWGRVRERAVVGTGAPLADATVTVFEKQNGSYVLWNAGLSNQANPARTNADGSYGFAVRDGLYQLVAVKDGFATSTGETTVTQNWLSLDIDLVVIPKSILDVVKSDNGITQNIQGVSSLIGPYLAAADAIMQSPRAAEVASSVLIPTAITFAVINAATAASVFHLINFLQFLLTQPLLLFGRRKRRDWGVVYNSLSKQPIDLAVVRLILAEKSLLIQTRITDAQGRYVFTVRPGKYRLEVVKAGFVYPTHYLSHVHVDMDMPDIYHGELIEVKQAGILAANIPVDPLEAQATPRRILMKRTLRATQHALGWISIAMTAVALMIIPSWWVAGLLVAQLALHAIFSRLSSPGTPKGWGIVYDEATKRPLERAIVRIFDKQYNKLLETRITDQDGKYGFFARKNVYYVTAERAGYGRYTSDDIDLTKAREATIDQNIALHS